MANCSWFDKPIRDLPSPLGSVPQRSRKGLITMRIERDVDSLTLRGAAYPALPQFESAVLDETNETLFVLIRANGNDQADAIVDLVRDLEASLEIGPVDISEFAVAFLFDANRVGLAATLRVFRHGYEQHFGNLAMAEHANWVDVATCRVGVFVVHKSRSDPTGTIEDHLAPMVAATWPEHWVAACDFINGNRKAGDAVSRNNTARLKAIITAAAQFQHPGAPLSTVVARDGIPLTRFKECQLSEDLVHFLQAVPWRQGGQGSD